MGLRPTRADENRRRRPREGGDPLSVDSGFGGNDESGVIFWRAAGDEESRSGLKALPSG